MRPVLLITRPEPGATRTANALRQAAGATFQTVISPLLAMRFRGALPVIGAGDVPVFTSMNGVRAYRKGGGPAGRRALAVGDATAAAACEAGLETVSAGGDVESLIALVLRDPPSGRLVHLRGLETRGDLGSRLRAAGLVCDEAVVYEQTSQPLSKAGQAALAGTSPVVTPVFSPRTAAELALYSPANAPVFVAAMSPAVADALSPLAPRRVLIAEAPTAAAMQAATLRLLPEAAALETGGGAE
ncbi:uroporphyrinogen-III synthase [Roseivivax marinus]|nr:uroporphyrinogen-III synthase [Roseivivax marinus]